MTLVQQRLVNAYAILLLANRMQLENIPTTEVALQDGTKSTIRQEAEVRKAEIEIERLTQ
ncbi:hypothetical protein [Marinisporobacter balticus]|uniref:Uncharacterized protein n=1 Tax=Marinisporobacter balticus TaxID=2018667 RepID=A0A4R2LFH0_9FIRM|nr:hypothetical protein [Marinisporobacter balticus]TCO78005.1 hypothetical protein EV214_105104 [Marinisporobacter balticus]